MLAIPTASEGAPPVRANKLQCKRLANRLSAIGEGSESGLGGIRISMAESLLIAAIIITILLWMSSSLCYEKERLLYCPMLIPKVSAFWLAGLPPGQTPLVSSAVEKFRNGSRGVRLRENKGSLVFSRIQQSDQSM